MRANIKIQYIYTGPANPEPGRAFTVGNMYDVIDMYCASTNSMHARFAVVDDTGKLVYTANGLLDDGGVYWSLVKAKTSGPTATDIVLFPLT